MQRLRMLGDWPGLVAMVCGLVLLLPRLTDRIEYGDNATSLRALPPAVTALGLGLMVGGLALCAANVALRARQLPSAAGEPMQAWILNGPGEIYAEARDMVRRCNLHDRIRATSITTSWPGNDSPEHEEVEKFFQELADKCAEAERQGRDLSYTTVLGFPHGTHGTPPPHKQESIIKRRQLFAQKKVPDRLALLYIETDWALDVIIVGKDEMILGFPTLPRDRRFRVGVKIRSAEFVGRAINWYDACVLEGAKPLTWKGPEAVASGA